MQALYYRAEDKYIPLLDHRGQKSHHWDGVNINSFSGKPAKKLGKVFVHKDIKVPPNSAQVVDLRLRSKKHNIPLDTDLIVEGVTRTPNSIFQRHRVIPAVNVVNRISAGGLTYSQVFNPNDYEVTINRGTHFANLFEAEIRPQTEAINRLNRVDSHISSSEGKNQGHKAKYVAPLNLEKLPKEELERMYTLVKEKLNLQDSKFCKESKEVHDATVDLVLRYFHAFSWDGSPG